jgi:hypothetical protein
MRRASETFFVQIKRGKELLHDAPNQDQTIESIFRKSGILFELRAMTDKSTVSGIQRKVTRSRIRRRGNRT